MCYAFRLSESLPARRQTGGRPWLFETLACNPPREPEQGSDFHNYIARNPLQRLDSEK
jgi:hypothetical protein